MLIMSLTGLRRRIISSNAITIRPVMVVMPMMMVMMLPMGDVRNPPAMNIKDDANNDDPEGGE